MRRTTIDIGTNTILMLIADFDETSLRINTVLDIQRIPRLGKGVDSNRNILPESFDKAIAILNEYKKISLDSNSEHITATASSFIRDSHNRQEFIDEINKKTGIVIEILSGEEEARWTFWGGVYDRLGSSSQITTIDIGGGSTEITSALNIPANLNKETLLHHQIKGKSYNIGSVRVNERFMYSHPPADSALKDAEEFIHKTFDESPLFDENKMSLIGLAGTITTLGAIKLGLERFIPEKVDELELSLEEINFLVKRLAGMELNDLYALGNYMEGRADIIIPGTLILKCFMEKTGFKKLTVSTKGLRYGVFLREVM